MLNIPSIPSGWNRRVEKWRSYAASMFAAGSNLRGEEPMWRLLSGLQVFSRKRFPSACLAWDRSAHKRTWQVNWRMGSMLPYYLKIEWKGAHGSMDIYSDVLYADQYLTESLETSLLKGGPGEPSSPECIRTHGIRRKRAGRRAGSKDHVVSLQAWYPGKTWLIQESCWQFEP